MARNTVSECEAYQPSVTLAQPDATPLLYESSGATWDNAIPCDTAWRSFRVLPGNASVFIPDDAYTTGCLRRDAWDKGDFPLQAYGECYAGAHNFERCPDYYVCGSGGVCLTSCNTDADCYVFEPWNDVSCPYAICNATSQCERRTDGVPGAGGSCPAPADRCVLSDPFAAQPDPSAAISAAEDARAYAPLLVIAVATALALARR